MIKARTIKAIIGTKSFVLLLISALLSSWTRDASLHVKVRTYDNERTEEASEKDALQRILEVRSASAVLTVGGLITARSLSRSLA